MGAGAIAGWRPKLKGTRPFRRRPWQAVAASEKAGIRGERQRVRASGGFREVFVAKTPGTARKA